MRKKLLIYKLATNFSIILWFLDGLLTIGSIANGTIGLFINMIMGIIFMLIGLYIYLKVKNVIRIIDYSEDLATKNKTIYNRFIFIEIIFTFISIVVGLIALSGIASRVFGEGLAVFG